MSYTPIGVIREELRAEISADAAAAFTEYDLDGVMYHALIEVRDDHACNPNRCVYDGRFEERDWTRSLERPPFRWAGAPARWPRREVTCGEQ